MGRQTLSKLGAGLVVIAAVSMAGCGSWGKSKQSNNPMDWTASEWHANLSDQSDSYSSWWEDKVVYHTDANVYFDPYTQTYYWNEMDSWHSGNTLPKRFTLRRSEREIVTKQHLLNASGNAKNVMAFNPHYEAPAMPEQPVDAIIRAAEAQGDYID